MFADPVTPLAKTPYVSAIHLFPSRVHSPEPKPPRESNVQERTVASTGSQPAICQIVKSPLGFLTSNSMRRNLLPMTDLQVIFIVVPLSSAIHSPTSHSRSFWQRSAA